MWKPYTEHILYLLGKTCLLAIFLTLFSEFFPILVNFHSNSNMSQINGSFGKSYSKYHIRHYVGQLLLKLSLNLTILEFMWKLTKMGKFSLNEVKKITNKHVFLVKYKICTVYGFHIYFQFRAQKWLPRDYQTA